MQKSNPYLTLIMATFNAADTLPECLSSIFDQTYKDFELIIADGKSTDGTVDILKSHDELITYWVSEKDEGIFDAWNKILPKINGQWVMFLGADDYLSDNSVLEKASAEIKKITDESITLVYGQVSFIDSSNMKVISETGFKDYPKTSDRLDGALTFSQMGLFHRSDLFEKFGNFDTKYNIAADYDFLVRVLKCQENQAKRIDLPVLRMSVGAGHSTAPKTKLRGYRELRNIRIAHGLTPAPRWLHASTARAAVARMVGICFGDRGVAVVANCYRFARRIFRKKINRASQMH